MSSNEELWRVESGLPDDFDFTIEEAVFETDARYMDGQVPLLTWRGYVGDDPANKDEIKFATGSGWLIVDGGARVQKDTGKNLFHKNSWVGRLVSRVLEMEEAKKALMARGVPTEAQIWVGTSWHMKRESVNYGGSIGEREHLMPTKFLGIKQVATGAKTSATTAALAAPVPTAPTAASTNGAAALKKLQLEAKVREIARTASSYADFQAQAAALEGLSDFPDIISGILDEVNGYWAKR